MDKIIIFFFAVALLPGRVFAQQRCATDVYQKQTFADPKKIEQQFENWISRQTLAPKIKSFDTNGTSSASYVIPVVFHIIHNGEPIGTGTNISDAQIISQVSVLNKDYRRLNTDASQTPAEFLSVAGSLDIEFVLAKQDPEGLASNGIVRVQGTKTEWTLADNSTFKALSYWPSEDYLNIWIINFNDPSNFIGYAQFPESALPGLENSSSDPLTDGVVLNYRDVGSIDDGSFDLEPQFNKGRTATHEIGHFFGLRHIWGDVSGCGGTDYVSDTPTQSGETNGCPTHPQVSCSANKMFQNYLDYTNDACMNLFTAGQVTRMEVVLQNSPRRASLTSSIGSQTPLPVANDLGLRSIVTPGKTSCGGTVVPEVEVRNYGTNTITSARIELKVNGVTQEVKDFSFSLDPLSTTILSFNSINLASPSSTSINFEVLLTNGTTDGKASDNTITQTSEVPIIASVPFFEFFDAPPSSWTIQNPDMLTTWENVPAANGTAGNRSMFINYYDYEERGVEDRLISPVINLDGATAAILRFDRSFAKFPGSNFDDRLRIVVVSNCNSDLSSGTEIFNKAGAQLATTAETFNSFSPTGAADWSTESISLNGFIGAGNIQLAFIGQNSNGNNLYLDNIFVLTGDLTDIGLKEIISPSPVVNKSNVSPSIRIKNEGSVPITSLKILTQVNGNSTATKSMSGLALLTGEELNVTLDAIQLISGTNQIKISLTEPNGITDEAPSNNEIMRTVVLNTSMESIPARQNFNISFQEDWTIVSQASQQNWEITTTNKGSSLVYRAFTNLSKGDEAWLVSPVLDFSATNTASLVYYTSYALSNKGSETLKLLASTDGGETFFGIESKSGNELKTKDSNLSWIPEADSLWKRIETTLNQVAGFKEVRLAFVAINDNGNNLFLDDIEFYNNDNPIRTDTLFRVYNLSNKEIRITFNLPEKETSRVQIFNMTGQIISDNLLPNNLNQTFTIDMSDQFTGIYIVRIQAANQIGATKVFIGR